MSGVAAVAAAAAAGSATNVFDLTTRFKSAVAVMNRIDGKRFPLLLTRILSSLHKPSAEAFNEAEKAQLQTVLALSAEELDSLLEACTYIFTKAVYHGLSVKALGEQLDSAGAALDRIHAIQSVWSENGRAVLELMKARTVTRQVLESVDWRLHLEIAQAELKGVKEPRALIALALAGTDGSSAGASGGAEAAALDEVVLEMSEAQLREFFLQLETMQEQLDALA